MNPFSPISGLTGCLVTQRPVARARILCQFAVFVQGLQGSTRPHARVRS
ncbi:MAG: hypothetical protein HQL88_02790 [Magnetococcales bacterium]|nr:hypothetical protein [Magnetococcales bacterium]